MIAVIGDVHGCYYTLVELYNNIKNKFPNIEIYAVGDFIDRGNNSFEVMEFIKNGSGIHQQSVYPFNSVDLFTDKRKNGRLVA